MQTNGLDPAPDVTDLVALTADQAREIDGGCFICDFIGDIGRPRGPVVCESTVSLV